MAGGGVIFLVAGLIAAALGAGVAITFWDAIRETVAGWLRRRDLEKSALMGAVVLLDRVAVGVRRRIRVRTARKVEIISEQNLTLDQIDDPDLRALVQQHGQLEVDILHDL